MSDRRRRFRNKKSDDSRQTPHAPFTIAKREDARGGVMQPKILRKEPEPQSRDEQQPQPSSSAIKTIIINRSDASHGLTSYATNSSASKDKPDGAAISGQSSAATEQVPRMNRPTPLILANGVFNANARKMFHKTNTDFAVIGVLGAQGVGKSALLNLLTADRTSDYDYYQRQFSAEASDCIFFTRHKSKAQLQKHVLRPRTEQMQFFISQEPRLVLLDTPPLLGSTNAKDADYLDTQSLSTVTQLLSVCHVLILAFDTFNLDQLRLLEAALRLRPPQLTKGYMAEHLPNVILVRTRAQRQDFEPALRERMDRQLALLYGNTGLNIYRGQGENRTVNSFLLPELSSGEATSYHGSLAEIARSFRERVLAMMRLTPHMCQGSDFSELLWFELLAESARKAQQQHFEKIFADLKLRHFDGRGAGKWKAGIKQH